MRMLMGIVVLLSLAGAATADETKLREEIGILRAEKQALETKVKQLTVELEKAQRVEAEIARLRTEIARGFQDINDRMARLEGTPNRLATAADDPPRIARNDTRPPTSPSTPTTPAIRPTPSITPPRTTPTPSTPTTPAISPSSPTTPATVAARPTLPRIPDPILPDRTRPAMARPKGTPTTVAMVDMLHLWDSLKEKQAIEDSLSDLVYAVRFADQTTQKKIHELQLDYSLLAEGSEAWLEKKRAIEEAQIERRVAIAAAETKLNRRRGELTKSLYAKMVQSIGRVADENGYDCVIFKEPEPQFNKVSSVNEMFSDRMVVVGADSVDLSEQVIRMMNRDFDRGATVGSAGN